MGLKEIIFNKGGIGPSLTREQTVERLNPIIRRHAELNHYYQHVIRHSPDETIASELEGLQKTARQDAGKLRESVFSAGGTAYSGTDLEPDQFDLGDDFVAMLIDLHNREENFREEVEKELDLDNPPHQIRSRAILQNCEAHSRERLSYLKEQTRGHRRSVHDR